MDNNDSNTNTFIVDNSEENGQTSSDPVSKISEEEKKLTTTRSRRSQPVESTEPRATPTRRRRRASAGAVEPDLPQPENRSEITTTTFAEQTVLLDDDAIKSSLDNLMTNYENAAEQKVKSASTEEIIKAGERELRSKRRLLARKRGRGRF